MTRGEIGELRERKVDRGFRQRAEIGMLLILRITTSISTSTGQKYFDLMPTHHLLLVPFERFENLICGIYTCSKQRHVR
jgi:hypothetical protein